ncbi:MAG: cytochrome c biogenesis protein ResB [Acidobacteriia bacterium]|nr:cytochrome c biogenesis protein ResB [Terriglobia bacterium]
MANKCSRIEESTDQSHQKSSPVTEKGEEKAGPANGGFLDASIRFLSTVRLGIYLLIILVGISFAGTIIPQRPNTSPENLQRMFAPANLVLMDRIGILDIFHAWWFKALLTLLGLNIVFASLDRFSHAWRYIRRPAKWLTETVIRAQHQHAEVHLRTSLDQSERTVQEQLKKCLGHPQVTEREGRKVIFSQRQVYSRLAAYGIHLSLLVIFAGGLIGLEFGYRARISLSEGESASKVILFDTARSVVEAAGEARFIEREIPFTLSLDKAEVVFNNPRESSLLHRDDIQSPGVVKNWYCTMSIWENGVKQGTQVVAVNQPLSYRGFRFFQSGFDFGNGLKEFTFQVRLKGAGGQPSTTIYRVRGGDSFEIKEAHLIATPVRSGIMPQADLPFAFLSLQGKDGKPALQFPVFDEPTTQKMRQGANDTSPLPKPPDGMEIFLIDAIPEFTTTLQVSRDPGVTTVWAGCILLMVGLTVAFYFSHQRLWAMLIPGQDGTTVVLGGDSSKNRSAFAKKFQHLVDSMEMGEESSSQKREFKEK